MIKFRDLFHQLVEDLSPNSGQMPVRWDADILTNYVNLDDPRLADGLMSFLKENDIKYDQNAPILTSNELNSIRDWIGTWVPRQFLPEVLYYCVTRFPDTTYLRNPSFAKEGDYRFMDFSGEGYMNLVFVDDGAGQALGVMMVDYDDKLKHFKRHFKKQPVQVHLSKMVPSVRGTGEGHKMYSLLLNKFGTIMSDTTLFEGSFAMWDTVVRQSAPYSGVVAFGDRLVYANAKEDVYTMSIPNSALDRFWASKTIQPWVLEISKALSKLNAKTTLVAELNTNKRVELVVSIIDKVSDNNTIKDLIEYLNMDKVDSPFLYNRDRISNPLTLLLCVTDGDNYDFKGIIKVTQKGSNLNVTLL